MDPLQQRSNSAKICLEVHDGYPCIFASILSTMFALTRSRVLVPYSYGANSWVTATPGAENVGLDFDV